MKWENNGDSWKSWKVYGKLVKDHILTKHTIKKSDKENIMENHTIVTLKKGEGRTIKAGGAWISTTKSTRLQVLSKMVTW